MCSGHGFVYWLTVLHIIEFSEKVRYQAASFVFATQFQINCGFVRVVNLAYLLRSFSETNVYWKKKALLCQQKLLVYNKLKHVLLIVQALLHQTPRPTGRMEMPAEQVSHHRGESRGLENGRCITISNTRRKMVCRLMAELRCVKEVAFVPFLFYFLKNTTKCFKCQLLSPSNEQFFILWEKLFSAFFLQMMKPFSWPYLLYQCRPLRAWSQSGRNFMVSLTTPIPAFEWGF